MLGNTGLSSEVWAISVAAVVGALSLGYLVSSQRKGKQLRELDEDEELDMPEEYRDPISLSLIKDPVVLCATGQCYDYSTLKEWFSHGNRLCPKTNIEVVDVQVTKLPWLRHQIHTWMEEQGLRPPAPEQLPKELKGMHPEVLAWIGDIRNTTGVRRIKATADLYELLRQWESTHASDEEAMQLHRLAREAVMDEMVWLIRYGDAYIQGVAASVLAYCDEPQEVQWLAACATVPAVSLCLSPSPYTSQAATRLLYNISRAGEVARRAIKQAGGVQSILKVVETDRQEYGYSRDRAAATLAVLAKDPEVASYLRSHALEPLKAMLLSSDDRWEQRDAATALLKLQFSPEELGSDLTIDKLCEYWWCSRAWLEGSVDSPNEGFTPEELSARAELAHMQVHAHALMEHLMGRDLDPADWGRHGLNGEGLPDMLEVVELVMHEDDEQGQEEQGRQQGQGQQQQHAQEQEQEQQAGDEEGQRQRQPAARGEGRQDAAQGSLRAGQVREGEGEGEG